MKSLHYQHIVLRAAVLTIFLLFTVRSCDDRGTVSFATNTAIVNTPLEALLLIGNNDYGVIPGYTDTVPDCTSPEYLNIELPAGDYEYLVEIRNLSGDCLADTAGTFSIESSGCTPVFIDVRELLK
ncbi:MAG: hypothetical protein ACOYXB_14470 [Bacteroidota bacterium]